MSNEEITKLIKQHVKATMFFSATSQIRSDSPTYNQIVGLGKDALPTILEYISNPANHAGMNVLILLEAIVPDRPYTPEPITTGVVATKVPQAREAWLKWGRTEGLLADSKN